MTTFATRAWGGLLHALDSIRGWLCALDPKIIAVIIGGIVGTLVCLALPNTII